MEKGEVYSIDVVDKRGRVRYEFNLRSAINYLACIKKRIQRFKWINRLDFFVEISNIMKSVTSIKS